MYSVLKNKRYHFEIPERLNAKELQGPCNFQGEEMQKSQNEMIVGSCFLDDVFILFLFNTGRYLIVKGSTDEKSQTKKSNTIESQVIFDGDILNQTQSSR